MSGQDDPGIEKSLDISSHETGKKERLLSDSSARSHTERKDQERCDGLLSTRKQTEGWKKVRRRDGGENARSEKDDRQDKYTQRLQGEKEEDKERRRERKGEDSSSTFSRDGSSAPSTPAVVELAGSSSNERGSGGRGR